MCDRVTILTKWAVTILVMAVLVVTGFVAILRVAILEWNHFQDSGFRICLFNIITFQICLHIEHIVYLDLGSYQAFSS